MNSAAIRAQLIEAVTLDLIGPWPAHAFERELLPENPTRWYLTGYLVPEKAPVQHRTDAEAKEEIDAAGEGGGKDDTSAPDKEAAAPSLLPSSMGLSVLVPANTDRIEVEVTWGTYGWEDPSSVDPEPEDQGLGVQLVEPPASDARGEVTAEEAPATPALAPAKRGFRRTAHRQVVVLQLPGADGRRKEDAVPASDGLRLVSTLRPVAGDANARISQGTRALCVFLVNGRPATEKAYQANVFQARLRITCSEGFVPRPDLRGSDGSSSMDAKVADLQYRHSLDYVSGIGCAAEPVDLIAGQPCRQVQTCWIPRAEVEFIGHLAASALPGVELRMEALAEIKDLADAEGKLGPLISLYRSWINQQAVAAAAELKEDKERTSTARELIRRANLAASRMEAGIKLLANEDVRDAFCTANRAMARQARQRDMQRTGRPAAAVEAPAWRAFQLGFILLNLNGLADSDSADRELVDLLFFPTGGGKTEAYLALAAFSIVLRRRRHPGLRGTGVDVLMRYTLRLLTLDQLGRATALICALELERQERLRRSDTALGEWPFEIGLWVGSAATPNRMGGPGDTSPGAHATAYKRLRAFRSSSSKSPSPIPLENCPWCGTKFTAHSFRLVPSEQSPQDLRITCGNANCDFTGDQPLPVIAVDEPIYRRLPCFLIATVDKFAALPWVAQTGKLFGLVERYDRHGFYSVAEPAIGSSLGGPLPPPSLIIQDELHLITGPLGTIAGVYETAIGQLAERDLGGGRKLRPKIIASTATVRQAEAQIQALFGRTFSMIFPPPGPDRRDTFFSQTRPSSEVPARLYLGIGAQGRSLKVVLLRTALALLAAGQRLYRDAGGRRTDNPADPYMTLLGYFNSLRELGGSRRIVEDEVTSKLRRYGSRRRLEPEDTLFAKREIGEPLELTSRVSTDKVADAKRRLGQAHAENDQVDVALATNMISVGLDITRLGLMVVHGQPKMSSEYIQATSRVGRDPTRPGLVITMLNIHKPRDRSHYERFGYYHATFYRAVEATSVTPFSPRALDRALAAALVALARHRNPALTSPSGASGVVSQRAALDGVIEAFAERALVHRSGLTPAEQAALQARVRERCVDLIDTWIKLADGIRATGVSMQYGTEAPNQPPLLHAFLDEKLSSIADDYRKFRANRSMRDVEPTVDLFPQDLRD